MEKCPVSNGEEFFTTTTDAYDISCKLVKALEKGNYIAAKANALQVRKLTKKLCMVLASVADEKEVRKSTL